MKKIIKIILVFIFACNISHAQWDNWQIKGQMKYPVSGGKAVVNNSKIYILGGYSDSLQAIVKWIQEYNPLTGRWRIVGEMNAERRWFQANFYNDSLFIFGGETNDSLKSYQLEVWNFEDNTTTVLSTNKEFDRVYSTGFIHNGGIVIVGGYAYSRGLETVLPYITKYQFSTDGFYVVDDTSYQMSELPIQQMGIKVDTIFYLFGGMHNGVLYNYDVINLSDNYFRQIFDNREISPRAAGAAVFLNQRGVYLIGGYNEESLPYSLSSVEIISMEWDNTAAKESGPELNFPRRNLMAVTYGDEIYVFGGENEEYNIVSEIEVLSGEVTSRSENLDSFTNDFILHQNYPNPFNPETKISYSLNDSKKITLDIFNSLGEKVYQLYKGASPPGSFNLTWNGKNEKGVQLPSGIYFYRLSAGDQQITKKMLLLR